jgi:hypothetical protein
MSDAKPPFTAFIAAGRIAQGPLLDVALAVKTALDGGETGEILIFDAAARPIEVDFRGGLTEVAQSAARTLAAADAGEAARRGPGRPKLGVVAREVTLLPRHWAWLAEQPGGASVALRKLVEAASRDRRGHDRRRLAQEAAYRFISAMAGDRPHFEEATRALFAGAKQKFIDLTQAWPHDIADHARALGEGAFEDRR